MYNRIEPQNGDDGIYSLLRNGEWSWVRDNVER